MTCYLTLMRNLHCFLLNMPCSLLLPLNMHACMHAETFFCVVDLHAITVPHDPVDLRQSTRTMAATYIAAGVDPSKVVCI